MKLLITKEKIQKFFIILTIVILVGIIVFIIYFFVSDYFRMSFYRKNPVNKMLIEKIDRVLAKDKKDRNYDDYLDLANSYYELKEYKKAIPVYLDALEKYPKETLFLNNLANAYAGEKDFLNAQKYYLESIEVNYQQFRLYIDLANLYKESWEGKQYSSEAILLKGLEKNPNSTDLMISLGFYYKETHVLTRAIYFFQEVLKIDPNNEAIQKELDEITKK